MKVKVNNWKFEIEAVHWIKILFAIAIGVAEFFVHEHELVIVASLFIVGTTVKDIWESVEKCGRRCKIERHRQELTDKALGLK